MERKDQKLYKIKKFSHRDIARYRYSYSFRYVVFLNGKMIGSGRDSGEAALTILHNYLKGSTIGYESIFQAVANSITRVISLEDINSKNLNKLLDCRICGITIKEFLHCIDDEILKQKRKERKWAIEQL